MVRAQDGKVVYKNKVEEKQVLDPRVAYLTTNLMEEVLRSGTAAGRPRPVQSHHAGGGQDRNVATMAGLPVTLVNFCAWSGWASTTTRDSIWKARTRRRPSGRSS